MPIWGYDGSAWRRARAVWGYDGSAWRKAKDVWSYDGSAWRKAINVKNVSNTSAFPWVQRFKYGNRNHQNSWNADGTAKWGAWSSYTNYTGWMHWCHTRHPNYSICNGVTSTSLRVGRVAAGYHSSAAPLRLGTASADYNSSSAANCFSNAVSTNRFYITSNMTAGGNSWKDVSVLSSNYPALLAAIKAGQWVITQQSGTQTTGAYGGITDGLGSSTSFSITYTYPVREFMLTPEIQSMYSSTRMLKREVPDEYAQYFKEFLVNDGAQYSIYATDWEIENILKNKTIDNSHEIDIMDLFRYREDNNLPSFTHDRLIGDTDSPFVQSVYSVDRMDGSSRSMITAYNMNNENNYVLEYRINGGEWKTAFYESPDCYAGDLLTQSDVKIKNLSTRDMGVTFTTRISKRSAIARYDGHLNSEDIVFQKDFRLEMGGRLDA